MKKILAVGVILLFIGVSIAPTINFNPVKAHGIEKSQSISRGKWLYVGGSGPGNYTKIQDAINDSHEGDTVFVYDETSPYYENVIINKSIKLIGENNETTIIDGSRSSENVIEIDSSNVIFKDFTIRNSPDYCWGIFSNGDNVSIINNIIDHNSGAVFILGCLGVKIFGNIISRNYLQAIELYDTSNAMISKNTITKHYTPYIGIGVILFRSNNNTIFNNTILDNSLGIVCGSSNSNKFYANKITHCQSDALYLSNSTNNEITSNILFGRTVGISIMYYSDYNIISLNNISSSLMESVYIENSIFNEIHHNNILKKTESAEFINGFKNNWDENFWYKPRFFPKPIIGFYYVNNLKRFIPLITFDWHPAQEPYDIPGMS